MVGHYRIIDDRITVDGITYAFAWKCSYMGTLDYMVRVGNEPERRCELRHRLDAYEESLLNPVPSNYPDQVRSAIGILQGCDPKTVAAFNAWRKREHEASIAFMRQYPERFGEDLSDFPPPVDARAGRINRETWYWEDWTDEIQDAAAA